MENLKKFTDILTGRFDNSEQFSRLKAEGVQGLSLIHIYSRVPCKVYVRDIFPSIL